MQLDQLIGLMHQKGATQLVMTSGESPRILAGGQWIAASTKPTDAAQMQTLLQAIAPQHLKIQLGQANAELEWPHFSATDQYKIQVHIASGRRTLTVTQEVAARAGSTPSTPQAPHQSNPSAAPTIPVRPTAAPKTPAAPPPWPRSGGVSPGAPPPLSPQFPPQADPQNPAQNWQPPTATEEVAQKFVVTGALVALALLVFSVVGYLVVYAHNKDRDFSPEFQTQVAERYGKKVAGSELSDVELTKENWRHYNGKGRFNDGDNAEVSIEIKTWDKLHRPDQWTWRVVPFSYGPMLAGQITTTANEDYDARGDGVHVRHISLSRITRTDYSGTVEFRGDRDSYSTRENMGSIVVKINRFDADGTPAAWSYSISAS